jgi:hypothetical protein
MRSFHFPLEGVLGLRRTQLEIEEASYQRLLGEVAALDRTRAELEALGIQAEVQVRQWRPLSGTDLAALAAFRGALQSKERSIAACRVEAVKKAGTQLAAMLAAQRRCRLLERLRERRLAEWRREAGREIETLAAESYLARWKRDRR